MPSARVYPGSNRARPTNSRVLSAAPAALAADCPAFLNHDIKKLRSSQGINLCTKYDGKVVERFDSGVRPDSAELQRAIERLLL